MGSLVTTHRPSTLDEIVGNEATVASIKSVMKRPLKDRPHAFLITGLSGGGKTTFGRIITSELGCVGNDFTELNTADFNGIATVRALREKVGYAPSQGSKCRVWLIDEVHMMTPQAQEAILKLLEDPPAHVYFILCTTDPQKLKTTVKNRCTQFIVEALSDDEVKFLIRRTVEAEGKTKLKKKVLAQVVEDSCGSARAALSILDSIIDMDPELQLKAAKRQAEAENQSIQLCRAIMKKNTAWRDVATIIKGLKDDPEGIRWCMLSYAKAVLLSSGSMRAALVIEAFKDNFYDSKMAGVVYACYSVLMDDDE